MRKYSVFLLLILLTLVGGLYAQDRELVILHTNDTHSQIEPYTYKADTNVGGYLRREALVREVRQQHPNVLLVDAGDFSQGTPYFNFYKGYVELHLMNEMGYDAVTLGNHEFDNGCAALAKRLKKARFATVCANYDFKNKALAKVVKPYVIVERGGCKIGIFGLTVDVSALVSPETAKDLVYHDPVEPARKIVAELRRQGCDLIVCLSHLGVEEHAMNDFKLAEQVDGIDVIVGGHSHKEFAQPKMVKNTRICQMTNRGKCVGQMIIQF